MIPYLLVICGVVSDFITTRVALSGVMPANTFYETHAAYSPLWTLGIFSAAMVFCDVVLGDFRHKVLGMCLIAGMSWLGAVNNLLVLLGVFNGLVI